VELLVGDTGGGSEFAPDRRGDLVTGYATRRRPLTLPRRKESMMTECQAVGCAEFAPPWGTILELQGVDVAIVLCRRHERELVGPPLRPQVDPTPDDGPWVGQVER